MRCDAPSFLSASAQASPASVPLRGPAPWLRLGPARSARPRAVRCWETLACPAPDSCLGPAPWLRPSRASHDPPLKHWQGTLLHCEGCRLCTVKSAGSGWLWRLGLFTVSSHSAAAAPPSRGADRWFRHHSIMAWFGCYSELEVAIKNHFPVLNISCFK